MESRIYERKGGRGWVTIRYSRRKKQVPFGFAQGRLSTPRPPDPQQKRVGKTKRTLRSERQDKGGRRAARLNWLLKKSFNASCAVG